jgi:GH24 family phage-related lysozyme (muramidase)
MNKIIDEKLKIEEGWKEVMAAGAIAAGSLNPAFSADKYTLQIGAYGNQANANAIAKDIPGATVNKQGDLFKVVIDNLDMQKAQSKVKELEKKNINPGVLKNGTWTNISSLSVPKTTNVQKVTVNKPKPITKSVKNVSNKTTNGTLSTYDKFDIESAFQFIFEREDFDPNAYEDGFVKVFDKKGNVKKVRRYSIGYGTLAKDNSPHAHITEEQAKIEALNHIKQHVFPKLKNVRFAGQNDYDAAVSFVYNTGRTPPTNKDGTLDFSRMKNKEFITFKGKINGGLINRRNIEIARAKKSLNTGDLFAYNMRDSSMWHNKIKQIVEGIEQPSLELSFDDNNWNSPTNNGDSDLHKIKKEIEFMYGSNDIPLSVIKQHINNDEVLLAKILPMFGYNKVNLEK